MHIDGLRLRRRHAGGQQTGQGMQALAAGGPGVVQGGLERLREFGLAPRVAGQPAFAGGPVARWQVEQRLRQAVGLQALRNRLGRVLVRKEELDRFKTIGGRGREAVQKGPLGVHHGQVGCKSGHGR